MEMDAARWCLGSAGFRLAESVAEKPMDWRYRTMACAGMRVVAKMRAA